MTAVLSRRSKGSNVPPNQVAPGVVFHNGQPGQLAPTHGGGGYWWGGGPRYFVGGSRGPETIVEVGRDGDFPEGEHVWGPADDDPGFPHSTRWPGYVGSWQTPFYATGGGGNGYLPWSGSGWGNRFMGGALLEARVSTVFTCVDLISRTLATMPIIGTKDSAPIVLPAWKDNPEPEIYTSMVDAMKAIVNSLLMRGEAFITPTARYQDESIARWVVLNPDRVEVEQGEDGLPEYTVAGIPFDRANILHIKYQTWPGIARGVGPLEAAWRNLISADALERWGTELALGNGIPTAVLQAATKLSKQQVTDLKQSWADAAATRGTLPVILSGGLTYTPLNLTPSDVGLLDLRTFDEARIASAFGVPLWLAGLPYQQQSLTYTTVAGMFDYFWRATLRSASHNIMSAISGFCLPRGQFAKHDHESFVMPDLAQRAQAWSVLIAAGVLSPEEVRVLENFPPIPSPSDVQILAQATNGGL